jgi:hypothetical protein
VGGEFASADLENNGLKKGRAAAMAGLLRIYFFGFERHIGAMIQRAFVNISRGFEFSLHQREWQAAFLAIDKRSARSFYNFGKQVLCAMTPRAFVSFYLGLKLSLDQE